MKGHLNHICYVCKERCAGKYGNHWDLGYFVNNFTGIQKGTLKAKARTCYTCISTFQECILPQNGTNSTNGSFSKHLETTVPLYLIIEYVSMILGDTLGILPNRAKCTSNKKSSLCKIKTHQEFLLRYYFKDKMPDLFLHFTSFAHDVALPLTKYKTILKQFISLVNSCVPKSTKYMLITSSPTIISKLPPGHISHRKYEKNMDYNVKIQAFNHILYELLKANHKSTGGESYLGFGLTCLTLDLMSDRHG